MGRNVPGKKTPQRVSKSHREKDRVFGLFDDFSDSSDFSSALNLSDPHGHSARIAICLYLMKNGTVLRLNRSI